MILIFVFVKGESMEFDFFGIKFNLICIEFVDKFVGIDIFMLDEEDEISCEVLKLCFCLINMDLI